MYQYLDNEQKFPQKKHTLTFTGNLCKKSIQFLDDLNFSWSLHPSTRTKIQLGTGDTGDTILPLSFISLSPSLHFKNLGRP